MSDDERNRKRKEHEDDEPDVEAHTIEDPTDDDPEKKRKRKEHEDDEDFGRKRK